MDARDVDASGGFSGQDAAFLAFEAPGRPMHVAALAVFEADPTGGSANPDRVREILAERLGSLPPLRRRVSRRGRRPQAEPCDACLDQVRVLRFPGRSDSAPFQATVDRLFARPLDARRPLWEAWVLSGLDGRRRFAVLLKAHHCLLDGAAAVGLLAQVFSDDTPAEARAVPRPARRSVRLREALGRLLRLVGIALRRTSATPLNGACTPRRELATVSLDARALGEWARSSGATSNDALLTLVTDGLRRWLAMERLDPDAVKLRALCPVSLRRGRDARFGNRLGAWLVDLPVDVAEARDRLRLIREQTARARSERHHAAVDLLGRWSGVLPRWFPALGMWLAGRLRAFNLVVTKVPPVAHALRLPGARLVSLTAFAPIFTGQRCSIAAMTYDGRVELGITGALPEPGDSHRLASALRDAAAAVGCEARAAEAAQRAVGERRTHG
ncbi:MAG: wax ester/triacylglycerol synthase family O-acyltransferase [Myxococcota bacterium]|nr:wax ester/triacylglycerol synthase family O-acyltransferase [Myxococcota bacterium]